jgi:hypothetical protein
LADNGCRRAVTSFGFLLHNSQIGMKSSSIKIEISLTLPLSRMVQKTALQLLEGGKRQRFNLGEGEAGFSPVSSHMSRLLAL